MFDKGQLAELMKKAQQMQENLQKTQEELTKLEIEGTSGAGMVTVIMTGKHDIKKVTIDPSLMDDKEMLEDLIAAAVNDANRKLEDTSSNKMSGLTSGMDLPSGFKMPF